MSPRKMVVTLLPDHLLLNDFITNELIERHIKILLLKSPTKKEEKKSTQSVFYIFTLEPVFSN